LGLHILSSSLFPSSQSSDVACTPSPHIVGAGVELDVVVGAEVVLEDVVGAGVVLDEVVGAATDCAGPPHRAVAPAPSAPTDARGDHARPHPRILGRQQKNKQGRVPALPSESVSDEQDSDEGEGNTTDGRVSAGNAGAPASANTTDGRVSAGNAGAPPSANTTDRKASAGNAEAPPSERKTIGALWASTASGEFA
jgi:hypothetical protein